MAEKDHLCKNCGKPCGEKGHLCDAVEPVEAYICEHCGAETLNPRHICRPKLEKVNFVCMTCGRVAQLPGDLCNPRDIVLMANQTPHRRII